MRMDTLAKLIDIVPDAEAGLFKIVLKGNGVTIEFPATSLLLSMSDDKARSAMANWMQAVGIESAPRDHLPKLIGVPTKLQNGFAHYIHSVYAKSGIEISQSQRLETRKAFFSGALVTLGHIGSAAKQRKEDGSKVINELMTEALAVGSEIAGQTKTLN